MFSNSLQNRFYLLCRKTGAVLPHKYISDPFSFFHSINAYEDNGNVVVDLCCYRDGNIIKSLYVQALNEHAANKNRSGHFLRSEARRYVLPLMANTTQVN